MNGYLLSGVLAGIAGLLSFLIIHHFWIQPIWFILIPGLFLSTLGGMAVGWSFQELQTKLPPYPWSFLGLSLIIILVLLPSMLIAQFTPAPFGLDGSLAPGYTAAKAALQFFLELVLTSVALGAVIGWFLTGTREGMVSTAAAAVIFALGPGHNIPFLGSTPGVWKGMLLLAAIILVSSLTLMFSLEFLGSSR